MQKYFSLSLVIFVLLFFSSISPGKVSAYYSCAEKGVSECPAGMCPMGQDVTCNGGQCSCTGIVKGDCTTDADCPSCQGSFYPVCSGFRCYCIASVTCGDKVCNGLESCRSCPGDCGTCPPTQKPVDPVCGDGSCNGTETCSSCSSDCGSCRPQEYCGDKICNNGETCSSCYSDCHIEGGGCSPTATTDPIGLNVIFTGDPTTIEEGGRTKLHWEVKNAQTCTATSSVPDWTGSVAVGTNGSATGDKYITLSTAGTYPFTLTCKRFSQTVTKTVQILVTYKPPIIDLKADPIEIDAGEQTKLHWDVKNAQTCTASSPVTDWSGPVTVALDGTSVGDKNITLPTPGTITFTLTCDNHGVTKTKTVQVVVRRPRTKIQFTVFLHGLGNSGDNANPTANSLSNKNPQRKDRLVSIEVYDGTNTKVGSASSHMNYDAASGSFKGSADLGPDLPAGNYIVTIKPDQYLRNTFPGIQLLTPGQTATMPEITLVSGDVVTDNQLSILDYNIIYGCYTGSIITVPRSCNDNQKKMADLTDEGTVNHYDYNLFIRELSVQSGR